MCPGDELILTCKTIGTGFLRWTYPTDSQVSSLTFINTTDITLLDPYPILFQSFTLTFVSGNQTTVCSQATLITLVTLSDNGKRINCSDAVSQPVTATVTVRRKVQIF